MSEQNDARIRNANLSEQMKTSFLSYAMSVIVARALPTISLMDGGSNSKNEVWGYESYPQTSDLLQYTAIHKRDTSRRT